MVGGAVHERPAEGGGAPSTERNRSNVAAGGGTGVLCAPWRRYVLRASGRAQASTYKIGSKVSSLNDTKADDLVRATVANELAGYVLHDDRLPGVAGKVAADAARVSRPSKLSLVDAAIARCTEPNVQGPSGGPERIEAG